MRSASPAPLTLGGQALRFGAVGVLNTLVGYALIVALHMGADVGLFAANAAGYGAGLCLSYALNRGWTFNRAPATAHSIALFAPLAAVGFAINLGTTAGLARLGLPYPLAQAAGLVAYSSLVFLGMRHVLFAPRR
jgi:putative flippase GtrA